MTRELYATSFVSPPGLYARSNQGGSFVLLSLAPVPVAPRQSRLSRHCRQRVSERQAVARSANETIEALNVLAGVSTSAPVRYSSARGVAVERILNACARVGKPCVDLTPHAALQALLGSKTSPYEGWPISVAPFDASRFPAPLMGASAP